MNFAKRMSYIKASEIREILKVTEQEDVISFAGGLPAPELFPIDEINEINQIVLKEAGTKALQYTTTEGYAPLREWIANRMNGRLGTAFDKDNILITHGSQQGLDLSGKVFLDEGDVVLCESPTYLAAISAFKAYGCSFIEIPTDEEGMMMDVLEDVLSNTLHIKLIYAISTFQNPTGKTWSLERRRKLAELSAKYSVAVIEDNPYGELRYEGEILPSLKSMDTKGLVMFLGTFSKIFCPGLRLGWVAASKDVVSEYVKIKQSADLHTSNFDQGIADAYMENYDLDKHVEEIKALYKKRRDLILKTMAEEFPAGTEWTHPEGGLFLWLTFPQGCSADKVFHKCIEMKVAGVTGDAFYPNGKTDRNMRINFSNMPEEKIIEGVKRMAKAIRECM